MYKICLDNQENLSLFPTQFFREKRLRNNNNISLKIKDDIYKLNKRSNLLNIEFLLFFYSKHSVISFNDFLSTETKTQESLRSKEFNSLFQSFCQKNKYITKLVLNQSYEVNEKEINNFKKNNPFASIYFTDKEDSFYTYNDVSFPRDSFRYIPSFSFKTDSFNNSIVVNDFKDFSFLISKYLVKEMYFNGSELEAHSVANHYRNLIDHNAYFLMPVFYSNCENLKNVFEELQEYYELKVLK